MKTNCLIFAAIAMTGFGLSVNNLEAQATSTPNTPPPAGQTTAPPPGRPMHGMPPGFRGRMGMNYRQAAMVLRRVKMDLENSKEDFEGHRQTAIDACDKAMHELEAIQAIVQKEMMAKAEAARAAARAAQQAAQQQQQQTPAAAQAPAAPTTPPPNQ